MKITRVSCWTDIDSWIHPAVHVGDEKTLLMMIVFFWENILHQKDRRIFWLFFGKAIKLLSM